MLTAVCYYGLFMQAFHDRFEVYIIIESTSAINSNIVLLQQSLPAIKAYMASPEFLRYPVNNKIATWGGK